MVVTKNQFRPRRKKIHFTNAEILNWEFSTVGNFTLIGPGLLGQPLAISWLQLRTNIVVPYNNLAVGSFFAFIDDFSTSFPIEDDAGISTAVTDLFTTVGLNLWQGSQPFGAQDSFNEITFIDVHSWIDEADVAANGGINMFFNNGGANFGAGDPANYADLFLEYRIINLDI